MKFICQKDDLMQGLSLAAKASAARSPQAVLECVSITADAAGVLGQRDQPRLDHRLRLQDHLAGHVRTGLP